MHIGTEKTGTSSVQNFFAENREFLARKGILYPETPGRKNHTGLATAAQDISENSALRKIHGLLDRQSVEEFRRKLIVGLESEYRSRAFKTVIMSGEHCSSRLLQDEEVQWLRNILSPHFDRIKIVTYLRRQDDYLLSTYSTSLKSGGTARLTLPSQHRVEARYDYWPFLSRWARIFGRDAMICRKFERTTLLDGDIVADFLSAVGIDLDPAFEKPEDVNEALDAEMLEYLRLFNEQVPRFVDKRLNSARANIVPLLSKISTGPLITLPADELAQFMGMFEESNRKVASEYFGGVRSDPGDPLFEPRSDKRERTPPVKLSVERAVEIGTFLWQEKQSQLERVRARQDGGGGRKKKGANPARQLAEPS